MAKKPPLIPGSLSQLDFQPPRMDMEETAVAGLFNLMG
jgi:hypothetical protein